MPPFIGGIFIYYESQPGGIFVLKINNANFLLHYRLPET